VAGLSDIPGIGRLFASTRRETQETDIVLTLTPRIVRVLDLSEEDLRPFRVGRDGDAAVGAGGPIPLPLPVDMAPPPPPAQQPAPQPAPAPLPGADPAAPIRPPVQTPPKP
jgi:general secretion pathway protein D